jgi:hypothetical protein
MALHVLNPNPFASVDHNVQWMIITRAVLVFQLNQSLTLHWENKPPWQVKNVKGEM